MGQKQTPVLDLDKIIGEILRAEAKSQGKSLRALGEKTEISHSRIGQAFRGERALTTGEADRLCTALGLTPWKVVQLAESRLPPATTLPSQPTSNLISFPTLPEPTQPEPVFTPEIRQRSAAKTVERLDGHTTEHGVDIDALGEESQDPGEWE